MRRAIGLLAAGAVLALAAGCGTTDPAADGATSGKITVTDATGTVQLAEPATKVVALEWSYVEALLALDVTPVGVADIEGYDKWVTAGPRVPDGVVDVGTRQEPSLEKIKVLQPDLIITDTDRATSNIDALKAIAPVLAFNYIDPDRTQLDGVRQDFTEIAKAVGRTDRAADVLADLDDTISSVKDRLAEAGKADLPYALAQGYTGQNAPEIRMMTDRSLVGQLLAEAGMRNAWPGQPDEWGMTVVGVEALTQVSDATFLYVAAADDNIFTGPLAGNPIWQNLNFVKEERVHPLDPGTWFFGGPLSAKQLLEETAKALGA